MGHKTWSPKVTQMNPYPGLMRGHGLPCPQTHRLLVLPSSGCCRVGVPSPSSLLYLISANLTMLPPSQPLTHHVPSRYYIPTWGGAVRPGEGQARVLEGLGQG